jgi:hypothetical protein
MKPNTHFTLFDSDLLVLLHVAETTCISGDVANHFHTIYKTNVLVSHIQGQISKSPADMGEISK